MTSKESVAAQNRFIYFPDHLVRLPGPGSSILNVLYSMFTEPLYKNMFSASVTELFKPARANSIDDDSIGSFISRRFHSSLADNLVSAGIHGIYAGDIYQMSVRSIMPYLWYAEEAAKSVTAGFVGGWSLHWPHDTALEAEWSKASPVSDTIQAIRNSSVFTFRKGIGQLADRLETKLAEAANFTVRMQTKVDDARLEQVNGAPRVSKLYMCARVTGYPFSLFVDDSCASIRRRIHWPAGGRIVHSRHFYHLKLRIEQHRQTEVQLFNPIADAFGNGDGGQPVLLQPINPTSPGFWLPPPTFSSLRTESRACTRSRL